MPASTVPNDGGGIKKEHICNMFKLRQKREALDAGYLCATCAGFQRKRVVILAPLIQWVWRVSFGLLDANDRIHGNV